MLAIGCDHAGFNLKNEIVKYLKSKSIEVKDFGTYSLDSVNYPEFGRAVGEAVHSGECDRGIVVCSTGIGISISANKVPGIRASLCTDSFMAKFTRLHNNSNVLALGANLTGTAKALDIVETWLTTDFEGGRHQTRVDLITEIEKKYNS